MFANIALGALFGCAGVVAVLERRTCTEEDVNVDVDESGRGHGHIGDRNKGVTTKREPLKLYCSRPRKRKKEGKTDPKKKEFGMLVVGLPPCTTDPSSTTSVRWKRLRLKH